LPREWNYSRSRKRNWRKIGSSLRAISRNRLRGEFPAAM
jgi:hypothetical protein